MCLQQEGATLTALFPTNANQLIGKICGGVTAEYIEAKPIMADYRRDCQEFREPTKKWRTTPYVYTVCTIAYNRYYNIYNMNSTEVN